MTGEGVEPYAVHTVRALDAPGTLGGLRQAALEGATEPYTVRGPDHWRDAVAIFPQQGSLPVMTRDAC
eukprot:6417013-Lingulodinium_polyedra.AAC.1